MLLDRVKPRLMIEAEQAIHLFAMPVQIAHQIGPRLPLAAHHHVESGLQEDHCREFDKVSRFADFIERRRNFLAIRDASRNGLFNRRTALDARLFLSGAKRRQLLKSGGSNQPRVTVRLDLDFIPSHLVSLPIF